MNNLKDSTQPDSPSASNLFKNLFFTLLGAVIVTVLFIMPAEYGVDLTGVGTRLGLTTLENAGDPAAEPANVGAAVSPATKLVAGEFPQAPPAEEFDYYDPEVMGEPFSRSHDTPFRSDTIEVPLDELEHVEVKATMKRGDSLVYSWKLVEGDTIYTDFHADPHATDEYPEGYWVRYLESETTAASGHIVAPFEGNHGWYWMNIEENPVKVVLEVRGYYESLDEIMRDYQ